MICEKAALFGEHLFLKDFLFLHFFPYSKFVSNQHHPIPQDVLDIKLRMVIVLSKSLSHGNLLFNTGLPWQPEAPRSNLPEIEKKKFLVPGSMLLVIGENEVWVMLSFTFFLQLLFGKLSH